MRIGKPTRATRSKATITAAPATEEHHNEEGAKNNSANTAQSERDAAAETANAPSRAALAAAASAVAQVSEVRRTPRKRSKTKLYDAVEAAGGSKRQKRSARLASKERDCPIDPLRGEEEPDDVPSSPSTDKSAPPLAAGVEKTVIHLSNKNMIAWIRLRREFCVQSDDKVFERLLSFMKPRFTQKKAKPKLR